MAEASEQSEVEGRHLSHFTTQLGFRERDGRCAADGDRREPRSRCRQSRYRETLRPSRSVSRKRRDPRGRAQVRHSVRHERRAVAKEKVTAENNLTAGDTYAQSGRERIFAVRASNAHKRPATSARAGFPIQQTCALNRRVEPLVMR